MKLSTIQWLSKTIVLPLFIGAVQVAPVNAGQIDRSRVSTVNSLPAVTDLNLAIPTTASPLPVDRSTELDSIEPIWSNPPLPKERTNRAKSTAKSSGKSASENSSANKHKNSASNNNNIATVGTIGTVKKSRSTPRTDIAARSPLPLSGNYLKLVRDPNKGTNDIGNPIYTLEAYVRGEKYQTFDAVTGTVKTQMFDRNRGNNSAPLPDGSYAVSNSIMIGDKYEVGRTFISISPRFATNRTDLGIHLDRSFNQPNGYDGTAGCIGITNVAERDAINDFVTKYQPRNLVVKIGS